MSRSSAPTKYVREAALAISGNVSLTFVRVHASPGGNATSRGRVCGRAWRKATLPALAAHSTSRGTPRARSSAVTPAATSMARPAGSSGRAPRRWTRARPSGPERSACAWCRGQRRAIRQDDPSGTSSMASEVASPFTATSPRPSTASTSTAPSRPKATPAQSASTISWTTTAQGPSGGASPRCRR